jgi:hypothetical protein
VASHWRILGGGDHFLPRADRRRAKRCVCVMKGLRRPSNDARRGAVRLNSILPVCAPGHGGAPLFLPQRATSFEPENGLYSFALTIPTFFLRARVRCRDRTGLWQR